METVHRISDTKWRVIVVRIDELFDGTRHADRDMGGVGTRGECDGKGRDRVIGADGAGLEGGGFSVPGDGCSARHLWRDCPRDATLGVAVGQGEHGAGEAAGAPVLATR